MDAERFDTLTRGLAQARSRRGALATLLGGTLGLLGGLLPGRGVVLVRAAQGGSTAADCAALGLSFCASGLAIGDTQTGETTLLGSCVDVLTDPYNCGGCGSSCGPGDACYGGACLTPAPVGIYLGVCAAQGLTDCGGVCVDLSSDSFNCGACGYTCGGDPCISSVCTGVVGPPPAGLLLGCADAGLTDCFGVCVDTLTDPANCGGCGGVCGAGDACFGAACVTSAPPPGLVLTCAEAGLVDCGGYCVDIEIDLDNCGGCGMVCGPSDGCFGGTCVAPPSRGCSTVRTDCGGVCVDLTSDAGHCGACFASCPLGGVCQGGTCGGAVCFDGQTDCGGYCADLLSDQYNCGACHTLCDSGVCTAGSCGAICYGGGTLCTDDSDCCSGDCGLDELFGGGVCV